MRSQLAMTQKVVVLSTCYDMDSSQLVVANGSGNVSGSILAKGSVIW